MNQIAGWSTCKGEQKQLILKKKNNIVLVINCLYPNKSPPSLKRNYTCCQTFRERGVLILVAHQPFLPRNTSATLFVTCCHTIITTVTIATIAIAITWDAITSRNLVAGTRIVKIIRYHFIEIEFWAHDKFSLIL